jgi:hypothetical protein
MRPQCGIPLVEAYRARPQRLIGYLLSLSACACLAAFAWLQMHNLSQTEYLIWNDFWRNFAAFKEGQDVYPFIFHKVHTYAFASFIWYLDVLFASGSLQLTHAYVVVATLAALSCLALLTHRLCRSTGTPRILSVFAAVVTSAMWLSPSNASSFSYPLVDILASTLLLLLCLATMTRARVEMSDGQGPFRWLAGLGYLVVVCLGFLTLETFLAVPLALAGEALFRRRRKEFSFHLGLALLLGALYVLFIPDPVLPAQAHARSAGAVAHNFLVLLSSHYGLLFQALGISPRASGFMSQIASLLQLICLVTLGWRHYTGASCTDPWLRFPQLLAVLGIVAIALAAGLRFGVEPAYRPVPRYTPYSMMFSIAVCLLAVSALRSAGGTASFIAGLAIVGGNLGYLAAESGALWFRSHNVGATYIQARLEMSAYAIAPGTERNLGPSEPDQGLSWRFNLHEFLKERELSVFSSAGYRSLGTLLVAPEAKLGSGCVRRSEAEVRRGEAVYRRSTFEGVDGDGIFLAVDDEGRVVSFSFAAQMTPMDQAVSALLPIKSDRNESVFFARVKGDRPTELVRCAP